MTALFDMLSPDFLLHHAFYGSLIVGLVAPMVGVYFILRRLVFWGVALPQVSAAGIAFALMLQGLGFHFFSGSEEGERHLAIVGSFLFTAASIAYLAWREHRAGPSEGRIGAIYATAAAATILCLVWNPLGEVEMLQLLKGELVTMSEGDFHALLDTFLAIAACLFLCRKEFVMVSFDRDMAVTLGRNALAWDGLLFLLIGLTVSLGVMTVGPLVIFGFLVLPPLAALPWAPGMLSFPFLASALGGLGAFVGFYLSYRFDLPLGPTIVAVCAALLALSTAARRLKRA